MKPNPVEQDVLARTRTSTASATSSRSSRTTYRLTEHYHYWTKHTQSSTSSSRVSSSRFRRASPGRRASRTARRSASPRRAGSVQGVAMVTKRLHPFRVDEQGGLAGRHSAALGIRGGQDRAHGARSPTYLTPIGHGRQHVDAGIQDVPREGREGLRRHGRADARDPPLFRLGLGKPVRACAPRRRSRSTSTRRPASAARRARSPARSGTTCALGDGTGRELPDPSDARRSVLEPHPLQRARFRRRAHLADAQGPVHALR